MLHTLYMKLKSFLFRLTLLVAHGFIYAKRGLVVVLGFLWRGLVFLYSGYRRTLGFRVFKVFFLLQKRLLKHPLSTIHGLREWTGQRAVLQIMGLVTLVVLSLPHSRLIPEDQAALPGRQTLLYAVLGPGDQDFGLVEDTMAASDVAEATKTAEAWRQGAVGVKPGDGRQAGVMPLGEVGGLAFGGSAITKPIIIPGATLGPRVTLPSQARGRTELVLYEVKPGDVVGNIARYFGVSIETILWANNLTLRSYIRPGDVLKVLPVDGVIHKVARGDTVGKIAKLYGAKPEEIINYNDLKPDGTNIIAGRELIIPHGRKPVAGPRVLALPSTRARSNVISRVVPPASISIPAGAGYIWPAATGIITQYFGWRHTGVDIAGKSGTAIYAARAGQVVKSQCGWNGGYGCYIVIDHGDGVRTLYGHNSRLYVSVGEYVDQGQTVALMGSTGRSTGPHLHFEVRFSGRFVNPLKYVRR